MWRRMLDTVRHLLARERMDREIRDEIEHHISDRAEHLRLQGLEAVEAQRQARLEFGATGAAIEECREERGLRWVDEVRRNAVFALRQLRKNPAFAISTILTLGLCIGANTAIFSAVDAVLMKPLPFEDVDRLGLLALQMSDGEREGLRTSHDGRSWEAIRDHAEAVDAAVFKKNSAGRNLAVGDEAEYVLQQRIGTGFFRVLGVPLAAGREFTVEEDRPGGPAVAIISHELAVRLFE